MSVFDVDVKLAGSSLAIAMTEHSHDLADDGIGCEELRVVRFQSFEVVSGLSVQEITGHQPGDACITVNQYIQTIRFCSVMTAL